MRIAIVDGGALVDAGLADAELFSIVAVSASHRRMAREALFSGGVR
jgi:hypothetical protein